MRNHPQPHARRFVSVLCQQRRFRRAGRAFAQVSEPRTVTHQKIYTIIEGTSEIQRLVIARAISGAPIR